MSFWFSIIALHKLGAVVIPATHLLTKKDIVYRANAADIKMIVCTGEEVITKHIIEALPDSPTVKRVVSVGPEIPEVSRISNRVSKTPLLSSAPSHRIAMTISL